MKSRTTRVRLADVAEMAGVSTTTASRALNGRGELTAGTRAAVLEAAAQLSFRPSPFAQSLRTQRSRTIGLIVPHIAHPFYASVFQGAQSYLRDVGYRLILVDSGEHPDGVAEAISTLLDHWVDGILISTTPFSAERFRELLHGTACVFIDETVEGVGSGSVTLENREGIGELVRHLAAAHGHQRIAFLGGPGDNTDGRERRDGFVATMAALGLDATPELIRDCEWSMRGGIDGTRELLRAGDRPTAIVAASAELALGALAAARSHPLRLPADLALASFDDTYFAPLLEPALTVVSYDSPAMGARSAALLIGAIESDQASYTNVRVGVRLIPRRSCGCEFDVMQSLEAED
jgi:DNA-binding LacI/PurR family transcriptional regulator